MDHPSPFSGQGGASNVWSKLPGGLVVDILARVAASSFNSLLMAKLSCKMFNEIGDESYILQRVSLEKFEIIPWRSNEGAVSYFNRCKDAGNPEALYRQAVVDFFDYAKLGSSLEDLKRASEQGHMKSLYTLAIILLFSGDELLKQKGLKIFVDISRIVSKKQLKECRDNLIGLLSRMWIKNKSINGPRPTCCTRQHPIVNINRWDPDDIECEACRCDREITCISALFRGPMVG